ncbi:MAG: chromosome segregation ATPase [Acidimicrobiales bacterium]|jgi:chromosome segregation ATPase
MVNNYDREIEIENRNLELSQTNVRIVGDEISRLQKELMDSSANMNAHPDKNESKIKSRQSQMEQSQKDLTHLQQQYDDLQKNLLNLQKQGEKIQDKIRKEQLKNKEYRMDYDSLLQKSRSETDTHQRKFESENKRIQSKINLKKQEQVSWDRKMSDARQKVDVLRGRQADSLRQEAANTSRDARQNKYLS